MTGIIIHMPIPSSDHVTGARPLKGRGSASPPPTVPACDAAPLTRNAAADDAETISDLGPALARGDHGALEMLYTRWLLRGVALARTITRRDEQFGLDAVQDAFLRVIRTPPKHARTLGQIDAWMTVTVHSAALDILRSERRRSHREQSASRSLHSDLDSGQQSDALIADLQRRLDDLHEHDRWLLQMRHARGMSLASLAKATKATVGAVHGRIRRAVNRLTARRSDINSSGDTP